MPLPERECVEVHRTKFGLNCENCSSKDTFSLQSVEGIDTIASMILFAVSSHDDWKPYQAKVKIIVRFALYEACLNAIEHGVLNLGIEEKNRLKAELASDYEKHIETKWLEKKVDVDISCCVSAERIFIGIHDNGNGFKVDENKFVRVSETHLLQESGRGLATLSSLGFALYWNEAGNTVLCSFKNPSFADN